MMVFESIVKPAAVAQFAMVGLTLRTPSRTAFAAYLVCLCTVGPSMLALL